MGFMMRRLCLQTAAHLLPKLWNVTERKVKINLAGNFTHSLQGLGHLLLIIPGRKEHTARREKPRTGKSCLSSSKRKQVQLHHGRYFYYIFASCFPGFGNYCEHARRHVSRGHSLTLKGSMHKMAMGADTNDS